jgi:methylated-DNA-[protein]-cysteine S-methyltransferase
MKRSPSPPPESSARPRSAVPERRRRVSDRRGNDGEGVFAFDTELGPCTLSYGARGIRRILLGSRPVPAQDSAESDSGSPPAWVDRAARDIALQISGQPTDFRALPLDWDRVGPFARAVYRALQSVAPGETVGYGELARMAGVPGAARAVGRAMARNPFPIVVPCHRVVGKDGSLVGFSAPGGVRTKAWLLHKERRRRNGALPTHDGE